jgi:hypothetical protein
MKRILRKAGLGLFLSLALGLLPMPASAQGPDDFGAAPVEGSSQGSPYYGYIGTGVILAMIIFVICKSARR